MVSTQNLALSDGRTLRVHDSVDAHTQKDVFTVLWHHGSPQTGALLEPLLVAAAVRGIRLVSYGRPSYGGSTGLRGRTVASAGADVAQLAEQLGLERFAVMGASGGGPHALACAALLPELVSATACLASLAPLHTDALDWFGGMASDGESLRAALLGRAAPEDFELTAEFDPESFNDRDYATLAGTWASLGTDVGIAAADGTEGLVDDDLAFVLPWGFSVADIVTPVLYAQGGRDRVVPPAHAIWLLQNTPEAELWLRPRDGHISVLNACALAMDWLREQG